MNPLLASTIKMINLHGKQASYKTVTEGAYNVETGSTVNTETTYSLTMYKKQIRANQYNFPDLIGKESAMFYLANDSLPFLPAPNDKVVFDSQTYVIQSVIEHAGRGEVVLFKIIAVKG